MAKTVDYETLALKLGVLFKPSAPIDKEDLFCGRSAQVRLVVDAINQIGQHAVIFGERGVGKTSVSQILQVKLKATLSPLETTNSAVVDKCSPRNGTSARQHTVSGPADAHTPRSIATTHGTIDP